MQKITLGLTALIVTIMACNKKADISSETVAQAETQVEKRSCAAYEVLQEQLAEDATLAPRMKDIENFTRRAIETGATQRLAADGYIEIPVVVHVLYNTSAQNISNAQIQSQIDVLNEDYQSTNSDFSKINNTGFSSAASTGLKIRFVLPATVNGIANPIHKQTKVSSWSTNDAVKYSSRGGDNVIDPTNNLNMWVCNLGGGLLGYAQFPGGKSATDGVVILYSAFGSRNKYPGGTYINTYDLGRSATHEVGHWMNLRHIWGDDNGTCSGTDYVADTPNQAGENYGIPTYPHTDACSPASPGVMFMNYMDYTDDAGMYMFSKGQADRMTAVFTTGGPRAAIGK
jgi:hypothetical protein